MNEISEHLVPMSEAQIKESIDRLTNIYALVLGWEPKKKQRKDKNNNE